MKVDRAKNTLVIIQRGKVDFYHISSIISAERHLGIYYRNKIDRVGRRRAPWTPYSYLDVKLSDGRRIKLTCLMIDTKNPPFRPTHTYYRFFPYLKKATTLYEKREIIKENYKNEVSYYKQTLKDLSTQRLEEKIKNFKNYSKASVEAAKQLLAARKKATLKDVQP
jgi:hypothetical protein